MRIRTMLTLAFTAMVAIAFAAPTVASANWTENGEELSGLQWSKDGAPLSGEGGSLSVSGTLRSTIQKVAGSWGNIDCPVSATVDFDGDGGSGQLTEISTTPSNCKLSAWLNALCGEVTEVTFAQLPWSAAASESAGTRAISLPEVAITYNLDGPYCTTHKLNEIAVIGSVTATPDNSASISNLTLSGSGNWWNVKQEHAGTTSFSSPSPLSVSPAGQYGIIKRTATVAVNGTLGWQGTSGGMSCTVNGQLALEAGSEGKVTSLNWSNCSLSGALKSACVAVTSVTSNSLPWTIVNQGSSIKISEFPLTIKYSHCGEDTVSGEMLATPNNTSAISSTSLSGTLMIDGINRAWSGSLSWTPAGVFGL